jgi:hypothetical protein
VSLPVRTTPEADAQILAVDDWWRRIRPASPNLCAEELATAFELVGHAPNIGRLYRPSPVRRRVGFCCRALAITSTTFTAPTMCWCWPYGTGSAA